MIHLRWNKRIPKDVEFVHVKQGGFALVYFVVSVFYTVVAVDEHRESWFEEVILYMHLFERMMKVRQNTR